MLKRLTCLCLCAIFTLCAATAALAEQTFSMAGFDGDDSYHTWDTNQFFTRMQSRTGISFTFNELTDFSKWQTAKDTMFSTGELPDVLFKAELSTDEQLKYAQSGQLIDLKPLLEENAPHLWALLQVHPDWLEAITLPDGKIVALPSLNELPSQNAMWINKTWLDKLGLELPTDIDSLAAVLRAFKTGDPNGNGKADEIPLSFLGSWDLKFLAHAFGLVANDYNIYVDESGTVQFMPLQQGFTTFVQWLADLYAEGLLDTQGFYTADSLRMVTDDKAVATYGLYFGPNPMSLLTYKLSEEYVLLEPLTYEGKQIYRNLYGSVIRGTFAITSACADPAAMLRWVDTLYSEDGAIEAMAGVEGVDYTVDADGRWEYAGGEEAITSSVLYELSIYDSGNMPWLFPVAFYDRYSNDSIARVNDELRALQTYVVTPFPTSYTLTSEQEAEVLAIQGKLGRSVDEGMAKFVLGQWDAHSDEAVAAYQAELIENGANELVAFWQEIYNSLSKSSQ